MHTLPGAGSNPFQLILEVGELRRDASQKLEHANLLEGAAKLALSAMGVNINSRGLPPKQTLAQPFGGPAHGKAQYVPVEAFPHFKLVASSTDGVTDVYPYQVGMVIRVGPNMVASLLLIPEGGLGAMYEKMRAREQDIHLAVTEMIVRSVGLQTDLIDHIVNSMQQTAELTGDAPEDPIVVMLAN